MNEFAKYFNIPLETVEKMLKMGLIDPTKIYQCEMAAHYRECLTLSTKRMDAIYDCMLHYKCSQRHVYKAITLFK